MMPLPVEVGEIHQSSEETEEVVLVEEADKIHRSSEGTEMVPVEEAGKIHQSSEEMEVAHITKTAAQLHAKIQ